MLIKDVKKLKPLDRFIYWIRERHQIFLRRRAGKPAPWTDDEILQQYFFTCPYRENDKVTVWVRNNFREAMRDDPKVIFALIAFRWFNWIPTGEILVNARWGGTAPFGLLQLWNKDQVIQLLGRERDQKKKLFTGAFLINSPPGVPKLEAIAERIEVVWNNRADLMSFFLVGNRSLQEAHKRLMQYDGMGGFMSYEVVCDLRHTRFLEEAPDICTWTNPGPGCVRGLYRLNKVEFSKKAGHGYSPPVPKDFLEQMRGLLAVLRRRLPKMPVLEMREVEHSLCEHDKYERVLWEDGHAKRKYDATGRK